jgi:hypothetical protein
MFAATVNLTLYAFSEWLHTRGSERFAPHVPPNWLRRFAIACAFAFATWAGSLAILGDGYLAGGFTGADALTLVWLAMMLIGVGVYTLRRRVDVFPLALIAACVILLGMLAIARHGSFDDLGNFFLLALWLVVSSTVLGRVLMKLVRSWRDSAAEA